MWNVLLKENDTKWPGRTKLQLVQWGRGSQIIVHPHFRKAAQERDLTANGNTGQQMFFTENQIVKVLGHTLSAIATQL